MLTGHVGNWEWLSASFTMNDMPVTAIAKPQPNMDYTHALDELRSKINVEIFPEAPVSFCQQPRL